MLTCFPPNLPVFVVFSIPFLSSLIASIVFVKIEVIFTKIFEATKFFASFYFSLLSLRNLNETESMLAMV